MANSGGDPLRPVKPGDKLRLKASSFNTVAQASRDVQMRGRDIGSVRREEDFPAGLIKIKNTSGTARKRFELLGIDGVKYNRSDNEESFNDEPLFLGVTPAIPAHLGKWVILYEPLDTDAIGWGIIAGVTSVKLQVDSGFEDMPYASIKDGEAEKLYPGAAGLARIVWKEDGTGEKWAKVIMGDLQVSSILAQIGDALHPGEVKDATIFKIDRTTGAKTTTSRVVKVCCPILPADFYIPDNAYLECVGDESSGLYRIINLDACTVPYTPEE